MSRPQMIARSDLSSRWGPRSLATRSTLVQRLDRLAETVEFPVLLFVAATLPLEFSKLLFPVSWLDISRVGIVVGLLVLGIHVLSGTVRLRRTPLGLAVAAVVAIELLSFAVTRWPNGLKEAVAVVVYAGFAMFAGHVLAIRSRIATFAIVLLASGLVVASISVAQEVGGFYIWQADGIDILGRRNSTFGDPNITARFFAVMLIVALAVLAVRSRLANRVGLTRSGDLVSTAILVVIAMLAVGDVLTLSRIGWLAAALASAMWIPQAVRRRRIALGVGVFACAFAAYLVLFPSALNRASSVTNDVLIRVGAIDSGEGGAAIPDLVLPEDPTATTPFDAALDRLPLDSVRRYLVRAGLAMTIDHPVTGVGVGGFDGELRSTYWKYVPLDRRGSPTTLLHTDVMRIAAETGAIGLIGWLALIISAAVTTRRAFDHGDDMLRATAFAAGSSIVVILAASQFAGRFYTEPYLWLSLGVLIAVGSSTVARSGSSGVNPSTGAVSPP